MSSPEDKEKHRKRIKIRSKIAKELQDRKFHQRVKEDKKKKANKKDISFRELVTMMNEGVDLDD